MIMAASSELNGSTLESFSSDEKTERSGQNAGNDHVSSGESSDTEVDEYPHGMKLAMIVFALIVTMFIVSLKLNKASNLGLVLKNYIIIGCA